MHAQPQCYRLIEQWNQLADGELEIRASVSEKDFQTVLSHLSQVPIFEVKSNKNQSPRVESKSDNYVESTNDRPVLTGDRPVLSKAFIHKQTQTCIDKCWELPSKPTIRQRTSATAPVETITKERIAHLDILVLQRAYDVRMNLKREIPINEPLLQTMPCTMQRKVQRTSFITQDGCSLDLSVVQNQKPDGSFTTSYEIEVEMKKLSTTKDTALLFATLKYWTLFWMDCLPKQIQMVFLPIEAASLSNLEKDKSTKLVTVCSDELWIIKK